MNKRDPEDRHTHSGRTWNVYGIEVCHTCAQDFYETCDAFHEMVNKSIRRDPGDPLAHIFDTIKNERQQKKG